MPVQSLSVVLLAVTSAGGVRFWEVPILNLILSLCRGQRGPSSHGEGSSVSSTGMEHRTVVLHAGALSSELPLIRPPGEVS